MTDKIHRREFIKTGIAAGALLAGASSTALGSNVLGANDRIRVVLIGAGRDSDGRQICVERYRHSPLSPVSRLKPEF